MALPSSDLHAMPHQAKTAHPLTIALAGMLALAVAMGIGRFAFTPLMPMMLHDQQIDLPQASWLASANYLGYLLGAILCTLQPAIWSRWRLQPLISTQMVRGGLIATCVLTALMTTTWASAWPWLRFATGVVTAIAFVFTSTWCLAQLAHLNAPTAGGIIYAGPGIGIASSGLLASLMVMLDWRAATGWLAFGLLAAVMTALVWPVFRGGEPRIISTVAAKPAQPNGRLIEKAGLTIAYGLAGFGYIITATFLPVIARTALPGSVWPDLFWPILGVGVACGALVASRIPAHIDQRYLLTGCYLVQALGVALSNWMPTLAGFALGSVLVGLPFTAITFFVMQIGRRLHPHAPSSIIGLLSASFGACQIAGPPVAAFMLARASSHAEGFEWALDLAAASLVAGSVIYLAMIRLFPTRPLR